MAIYAALEDISPPEAVERSMNTKRNINTETFELPGERLNHLLDQIGFKQGRGRVTNFQNYLTEKSPNLFSDLKYTTVRSWFQEHAPPMRKIDAVIQALKKEYQFHHDISLIKTWWKMGGFYPFISDSGELSPSITDLQKEVKDKEEKLQFLVMSLVTEETGELFKSLSSQDLVKLKDKVVKFANEFADPFEIECPSEYLRMAIRDELSAILGR
ncbi:MAG: hypothetical protein MI974_23285 [Chitinophagales bacterium]|nr:hypothetical protein [Chitinophagales bacterium]